MYEIIKEMEPFLTNEQLKQALKPLKDEELKKKLIREVAEDGNARFLKRIIECGINIDIKHNILHRVIYLYGYTEVAKLFIEKGFFEDENFITAILSDNIELAQFFLQHNVDINIRSQFNGDTILEIIKKRKHLSQKEWMNMLQSFKEQFNEENKKVYENMRIKILLEMS